MARLGETTSAPASEPDGAPPRDTIRRFFGAEIWLHWAIAVPFLVCYLSALVLFVFFNLSPQSPTRALLSWIHRVSGLCLTILPLYVVARNKAHWKLYYYNLRQGWVWTIDDLKWLALSGAAAMGRKVALPEQGKFNAGEKLNFMMVTTTYPLFIVTGLLVWLPGVPFYAWLAHVIMAFIATPLVAGHIFMATINPETRTGIHGMVTGHVDRRWARHHYTRWYREHFGDDGAHAEGEPAAASPPPASRPLSQPSESPRPEPPPSDSVVGESPAAEVEEEAGKVPAETSA